MCAKKKNDFVIYSDYKDRGHVLEYSESLRSSIIEAICSRAQDEEVTESLPLYDDEFLFIYNLLLRADGMYMRIHYDPIHERFSEGCTRLPFIRLCFFESGDLERSPEGELGPKDKSLGVSVKKESDEYVLKFNRYMLFRVLEFLKKHFDDNEELALSIPAGKDITFESIDRDEALSEVAKLEALGLKKEAKEYLQYVLSRVGDQFISPPIMQFYHLGEGDDVRKIQAISVYDPSQDKITTQLRKPIYLTSGFNRWFHRRNELVRRLFVAIFQFIVIHETAHVANGHCDLPVEYAEQKKVSVCAEANADDTAIRWWLTDLLFDTLDGTPWGRQLSRTKEELVEEIEIRVLGAYLALSWVYRDEDRIWSGKTLDEYISNGTTRHPIYQFRTFNIIHRAMNLVAGYVPSNEVDPLLTLDNVLIDNDLVAEITHNTFDILSSFETYFDETYRDTRSTEQKLSETLNFEKNSQPFSAEKVPFLMPVLFDQASEESKVILDFWPSLRDELYRHKVYCKLYEKIG